MFNEEKNKNEKGFQNFFIKKKNSNEHLQEMELEEVLYKDPVAYEKYIRKRFECMKSAEYKVVVTPRLYYRATKDQKIKRWFEQNLYVIPFCMKSIREIIAVTGGSIVSCTYHMINYNNISTDVCVTDETGLAIENSGRPKKASTIRTTNISEIETQVKYNSIFWTPEIESAGFQAQA